MAVRNNIKSDSKPDTNPDIKPNNKPDTNPDSKPDTKQNGKSDQPDIASEWSLTQSISNSFSREDLFEEYSISKAALGLMEKESVSISNEQIKKGDPILDTYQVQSDAIHGGMGSVWRVYHTGWDVDLAMKRPQPRFFAEGGRRRKEGFVKECENWINLGLHPNIVSCYYVRDIGGVPTIFSEWMDGGSLKDCIRNGSLYEGEPQEIQERILDIAIQAARGLSYSHENNLIHQDVKPGNLLLKKDWEVKIADFGLAKASTQLEDEQSDMLSTGYTLEYCPKEQAEGAAAEEWMDVYAWAVTVLEMYSGRRLWDTGAEVGENWQTYAQTCRYAMPGEIDRLLAACVKGRSNGFHDILPALLYIYKQVANKEYPRPASKEAPDTTGSLNNRALSFLDLGKEKEAEDLWTEALRKDPLNAQARFNRELFLVRSGKKMDFQGIDELQKYPETAGEYKDAMIREFGGKKARTQFLDRKYEHCCFDGDALSAMLEQDTIWLALRHSFEPLLIQLPVGGGKALQVDRLNAIREKKETVWHMALHPNVRTAAFWVGEHTVYLYNIAEKQITAKAELPEELEPEHEVSPDTETVFFKFSTDGRFLLLGNVAAYKKRSLILDANTLQVVEDLPYGLPGAFSRCLIVGNPDQGNEGVEECREHFTQGSEGAEECREHFAQGSEGAKEWHLHPARGCGGTEEWRSHPALTGRVSDVFAIDPEQNIAYANRLTSFGHRLFVTDLTSGKVYFTLEGGCLNDPWADWKYLLGEDGRSIVAWRGGPDITYWVQAELPRPTAKEDLASWQLSRLQSIEQSTQDEEKIKALQARFTLLMEQRDYAGAIAVHESMQEIPAYPMSEEAGKNEEVLMKVARIKGIRTIRNLGETDNIPETIQSQRKSERPAFLPEYIRRSCRRGDQYYAFNFMLDCEVYDADGHLLSKPIKRKSPNKEPDEYHCPHFCDLDSTGQYLLYSLKSSEDPYGKKQTFGTYLRDLHEASKIRLFRPKDTLTEMEPKREHYFLKDGTIIESWDFGYRRFAPDAITLLQEIKVTCEGRGISGEHIEKVTSVDLENDRRWIVCCNTAYYTETNDTGYYFSVFNAEDGKLLYHWYDKENNLYYILPGERFFCTWGKKSIRIRDLYTGEETDADKHMMGGFYALPGSRMLYLIQEDGKACAYEIEFNYTTET